MEFKKSSFTKELELLAQKVAGKEQSSAQRVIAEFIKDIVEESMTAIEFPKENIDVTIWTAHDEESVQTQLVFRMRQDREEDDKKFNFQIETFFYDIV